MIHAQTHTHKHTRAHTWFLYVVLLCPSRAGEFEGHFITKIKCMEICHIDYPRTLRKIPPPAAQTPIGEPPETHYTQHTTTHNTQHTRTHARTHPHTQAHTSRHPPHTHTHTRTRTHTHTTHTHHIRTYTQHTRATQRTRTHTHTHIHTPKHRHIIYPPTLRKIPNIFKNTKNTRKSGSCISSWRRGDPHYVPFFS